MYFRKKEIVLIPYWIQESLARKNLPLDTCLKMDTLRSMTSVEDLAGFAAAQQFLAVICGCEVDAYGLESNWNLYSNDLSREFIRNVINVHKADTNTVEGVRNRLFNPELKKSTDVSPFITYDIAPTALGVVVNPGFFTANPDRTLQYQLLDSILNALYDSGCDVASVNSTSIAYKHLKLMAELKDFGA